MMDRERCENLSNVPTLYVPPFFAVSGSFCPDSLTVIKFYVSRWKKATTLKG